MCPLRIEPPYFCSAVFASKGFFSGEKDAFDSPLPELYRAGRGVRGEGK
jgi:hypothetical protein